MLKIRINTRSLSPYRLLIKSDGKRPSRFAQYVFKASLQYRIKFLKYEIWLTRKRFKTSEVNIIEIIAYCFLKAGTFDVIQVMPGMHMTLDVQNFIEQVMYRPLMPYFGYKGGFRFRRPSKGQIYRLREALKTGRQ